MPVPKGRTDEAYFGPLDNLRLHPETKLYLGLVHYDDSAGNAARIAQRGGTHASTGLPPNAAWRAATLRGCRHCWPRTSRPHGRPLRRSAGEA